MTAVKIAYYRKEDWKKLLEIIDDKESMHETWNQWFKAFTSPNAYAFRLQNATPGPGYVNSDNVCI